MLNEVSSATTVMPLTVAAPPRRKNGRAKASASSSSAATRSASSSSSPQPVPCRMLDRRVLQQLHRGELDACSGSRLSRCRHDRHRRRERRQAETAARETTSLCANFLARVDRYASKRQLERLVVVSSW